MKRSNRSKLSSKNISNRKLTQTYIGLRLIRRFQNALAKEKLLPRGSKILVAVSGGPDSMALLHILNTLKEKHDFTLHVAHVNYQLRGQDSEKDAAMVKKMAEQMDLPLSLFRPSIKPKTNIEESLRVLRYDFFEKVRREKKLDVIVTAHTMNDVAETLLLNLLRGSGILGLSPFAQNHTRVVRPLITFSKTELLEFLSAEKITFRTDKTNRSKKFTRNRIRHELLPLMETFNPSIIETLARTARHLGKLRRGASPPHRED